MGRTAGAIANFFRLAFWPIATAILVVLLLQPLYFLSLTSLGFLTSHERTVRHIDAAFQQGVLSDDGNPRSLIFKGGEQLTGSLAPRTIRCEFTLRLHDLALQNFNVAASTVSLNGRASATIRL
ncbi:MAG TPA: hypothetical protein VGF02_09300 [Pseudolabrys sp.]|jgi:hypothetical protein